MAADNSITVTFNADTSGLEGGVNQIVEALQLMQGEAESSAGIVTTLFSSMQRAADQSVKGILQGTQTWQQALQRTFTSILASFIDDLVINRSLQWAKSELEMTAATEEGNALRVSSDEAAGSASVASKAGQVVSSIMNDAKEVFGGIFAFLAPEMGPAAAGPASAGSASVAALASGITYAESGAWNIPSNTLAYLHAGEMVVPQSFASNLRNSGGLGSGGDNYTININAIDTQTGTQFLKNNAASIASALSSQVRQFSRAVPVWKS